MEDRIYMQRAIELARRGTGWVSPNPLVGAVIVKDGRVIGEGWHHKYGDLHAERDALANLTEPAEAADRSVPCLNIHRTCLSARTPCRSCGRNNRQRQIRRGPAETVGE